MQGLLDLARWRAKGPSAAVWVTIRKSLLPTVLLPLFIYAAPVFIGSEAHSAEIGTGHSVYYGYSRRYRRGRFYRAQNPSTLSGFATRLNRVDAEWSQPYDQSRPTPFNVLAGSRNHVPPARRHSLRSFGGFFRPASPRGSRPGRRSTRQGQDYRKFETTAPGVKKTAFGNWRPSSRNARPIGNRSRDRATARNGELRSRVLPAHQVERQTQVARSGNLEGSQFRAKCGKHRQHLQRQRSAYPSDHRAHGASA